jgi:CMP-N,N'-diacetyllegionaminic acid synthase
MNILCTVCARSGSKGLKNKNLLKIKNKSLIDHALDQALKVKKIDKIVFSSDIKNIKEKKNTKIYYLSRPVSLSGDRVSKLDVIRHATKLSEKYFKKEFQVILDLDVSSPLRNISDIKKCINMFKKSRTNNLVTICQARKNPYFNMLEKKGKKFFLAKKSSKIYKSRQEAPKIYEMNASIYIWKKKYLFSSNNLIAKKTSFYEMPYDRSIDIDNKYDFKIVKLFIKK